MSNYDYEKLLKNIYKYELNKLPNRCQNFDFIPLCERRDYGKNRHDFLEQKKSKNKGIFLPEDLLKTLNISL